MNAVMLFKFIAAFVFVISMMMLLSWFLKRLGLSGQITPTGSKRRLKVIEHIPLDAKHRMVLVRRDDTEHLVLLSQQGATLVERGIVSPVGNVVEYPGNKEQEQQQHA